VGAGLGVGRGVLGIGAGEAGAGDLVARLVAAGASVGPGLAAVVALGAADGTVGATTEGRCDRMGGGAAVDATGPLGRGVFDAGARDGSARALDGAVARSLRGVA
jgi:hypothetical protein